MKSSKVSLILVALWGTYKSLPTHFYEYWAIPERLQTWGSRIYIRGQNNVRSPEKAKHIYHLIGHKFSQFQALFGYFMYKTVEIIYQIMFVFYFLQDAIFICSFKTAICSIFIHNFSSYLRLLQVN